jgi:hypothetical protein
VPLSLLRSAGEPLLLMLLLLMGLRVLMMGCEVLQGGRVMRCRE